MRLASFEKEFSTNTIEYAFLHLKIKKQWENGHSSFDLEIIIWALELIDDVYVEPHILEINLTKEKYLYLLQHNLTELIHLLFTFTM